MCRTVQSLGQTLVCLVQMIIRIIMTTLLMLENLIRLIMQTIYNLVSFLFQMCSLIPICLVFLLTSKLKFLFCSGGGGGGCTSQRGGNCDCIMSALAVVIIFFVFKATGVLDKIFYKLGYVKNPEQKFLQMPEEHEHMLRNGSEDYQQPVVTKHEVKMEDYVDTTTVLPTTVDVPLNASNSSVPPANWTTVYYYLI